MMATLNWAAKVTTVDTYCELHSKSGGILSDGNISEIKKLIKIYPQEFGKILHAFFEPTTKTYATDSQYFAMCLTAVEVLLLSNVVYTKSEEERLLSFVGKEKELDADLECVFGKAKLAVVECIIDSLKKRYFVCEQLVDCLQKRYFDGTYYDNVLSIDEKENVPVLYYFVMRLAEYL